MPEEAEVHGDAECGKIISTSKNLAAVRQLQAAIRHFWQVEYECAITLAAAAEGVLPTTEHPHVHSVLRASAPVDFDSNLFINWLKHNTVTPDDILLSEHETAMIIVRAVSKLIANKREGTDEMRHFIKWAFARGFLVQPEGTDAKA